MLTVTDRIHQAGQELLAGVSTLLEPSVPLRNLNDGKGPVIIGSHYAFPDLSIERRRLQSQLIQDYRHFITIVRALVRSQPGKVQRETDQHDRTISDVLEQRLVWHETTGKAMTAVERSIKRILDVLASLYDPTDSRVVLVPDTNALIASPPFSDWTFDGLPQFDILLIPAVLAELDGLKVNHRNPDVRDKALKVIRQIKEYRRRGPLSEGVAVVSSRIHLRSTAVEPKVSETLPWLDADSPDDRILASFVEVMRAHLRSVVVLITADLNLQNKAEFARLTFLEPPKVQGCGQTTPEMP